MFEIRHTLKDSDLPFIYSSWLKSFKKSSSFAKRIRDSIYYKAHHEFITALLKSSKAAIAHVPGDEDVILGYVIYQNSPRAIVHYVFIKEEWRMLGIAKALLSACEMRDFIFTHWTYPMDEIIENHTHLVYDPYAIQEGLL